MMAVTQAVTSTDLDYPVFSKGKVRDTYELDADRLLMVATDRISAFDWVMPDGIPDRGRVLTQLSVFWFDRLRGVQENHLLRGELDGLPAEMQGRCMVVRRAKRIDFECVVRGYLAGSAWSEYRQNGTMTGEPLPTGLRQSERLPEPIFTPASKADTGHDENITFSRLASALGVDLAGRLKDASLKLYQVGTRQAEACGLILADTKFEFGLIDGRLILIDEVLTPDSSRYWDSESYRVGTSPESFDKQFLRDWLASQTGWDRNSEPPRLPEQVVEQTRARYLAAYQRLTGHSLPAASESTG